MAGLQERVEEWEDEEELEQGFGCHGFLCSHWLLRRSGGAPSRSLLHGHGGREELWWKRKGRKTKQLVLDCVSRANWRALVQTKLRFRCRNNSIIRNKPLFHYDTESYALNFEEDSDQYLNFSDILEARSSKEGYNF